MSLLDVRIYPDPVLLKEAAPVEVFDADLVRLVDDMAETMYHDGGVGLAAPQVGVSRRILVMDCSNPNDPDDADAAGAPGLLCFINPEILTREGLIAWEEGCLSFPGLTVEVERSAAIRVRAYDARGAAFEIDLKGLPSVCLQHELDHLDGVVILERVGPLRRRSALARWKKLEEERAAADAPTAPG